VRSDPDLRAVFAKRFALLTYKDPELPVEKALNDAFTVLRQSFDLPKTQDQEVLGLAGAIWKRRFDMSTQKRDLELSAAYYTRGFEQGTAQDQGYTGINAASCSTCSPNWRKPMLARPARRRRRRNSGGSGRLKFERTSSRRSPHRPRILMTRHITGGS
jgi:hypothetical protein